MMNSYKRNYSSLGFVAGDVEVDWGGFEPSQNWRYRQPNVFSVASFPFSFLFLISLEAS
jgi:hypothetical protein